MEEYFLKKITEIQGAEDASYLLENNDIFYDIGYKVMRNQENANLLKCHHLKYNGKIKLVYFTHEYISMADYVATADPNAILNLIYSLVNAFIQIENLGFLNMACIDNRLDHVYVDTVTNNVKIIYLPVNIAGLHKNKNEFDNEIKTQLVQLIEQTRAADMPQMRQTLDVLKDAALKLQDILQNSSMMRGISIQSINGQFCFNICESEFLIGKNSERVQGVITGNNAISRVHCKVIWNTGQHYIVDMGSSNGTYVNGKRILPNEPEPIYNNTQIRIANEDFIVRG